MMQIFSDFTFSPMYDFKKLSEKCIREDFKKKKSKISDIGKKGREGWDQKTYF